MIIIFLRKHSDKLPESVRSNSTRWMQWYYSRFLLVVIAHPAGEELFFRMPLILLFPELSIKATIGIFVSALLFALMHNTSGEQGSVPWNFRNWWRMLRHISPQFIGGILFGITAVWTQSLLFAVLFHASWNLLLWISLQRELSRVSVSISDKLLFGEWYVLKRHGHAMIAKLKLKLNSK